MPQTLKIDTYHDRRVDQVATLQKKLNALGFSVKADGYFGGSTLRAVEDFQEDAGLFVDGVVGPMTWKALAERENPEKQKIIRVELDAFGEGYSNARLLESTAKKVEEVREWLVGLGGILTSSGGLRSLSAPVTSNRSATSFHYSGRALDLFVYSGMRDVHDDPYVVVADNQSPNGKRCWVVWARVSSEDVPERSLVGTVFGGGTFGTKTVTGRFVNLTEAFSARGMYRIPARSGFNRGVYGAAEWWHFQDEEGLVRDETFFSEVLLQAHNISDLRKSKTWDSRHLLFGSDWG